MFLKFKKWKNKGSGGSTEKTAGSLVCVLNWNSELIKVRMIYKMTKEIKQSKNIWDSLFCFTVIQKVLQKLRNHQKKWTKNWKV